jgi:lipid A 4'-phosphatase
MPPPLNAMQTPLNPPASRVKTPLLFWWITGGFMILALLPTVWTSLDLNAAALFMGPNAPIDAAQWWWVELINLYIPAVFRTVIVLALMGWLMVSQRPWGNKWRLPLAFVVLAGALGPGLLVNSGFKDNWQRARPYQVQPFGGTQQFTRAAVMTDQCDNNCSFVSGHVACGFFLASIMLVQRRRQWMWGAIGVAGGLVIGFARMADGAHWLSDVLWASPITLLCSWCIWKVLTHFYTSPKPAESSS